MKSYELGVVALAVVGIVLSTEGLVEGSSMAFWLFDQANWQMAASTLAASLVPIGVGLAIFFARERIARFMFRGEELEASGPGLDEMQAVGLSFVAVWLALDGAWRISRLVLPMLFYGDKDSGPWSDLVPDLMTVVLAALLFFKAEVLVRLWRRTLRTDS